MKGRSRGLVSLWLFVAIAVVVVTGALSFLRPFSLTVVSLHTIFGLCFAFAVVWHIRNNFPDLKRYLKSKTALFCVVVGIGLALAVVAEVPPVRAFMGLSSNAGPSPQPAAAEVVDDDAEDRLVFRYEPAEGYVVELTVLKGPMFTEPPPKMAIWLENESAFHIHTLHTSEEAEGLGEWLPYWNDKHSGWQEAKEKFEAEQSLNVDAVSEPTKNKSFDPADYVLPETGFFFVLLEIAVPGMDATAFDATHRSLVYTVAIDNADPAHFLVMDVLGTPVEDQDEEKWQVSYDVSALTSTKALLDSILVKVYRNTAPKPPEDQK